MGHYTDLLRDRIRGTQYFTLLTDILVSPLCYL
jgi:hypothetical protein